MFNTSLGKRRASLQDGARLEGGPGVFAAAEGREEPPTGLVVLVGTVRSGLLVPGCSRPGLHLEVLWGWIRPVSQEGFDGVPSHADQTL